MHPEQRKISQFANLNQASVLAQIGLIDSKRLPITGIAQAERLLEARFVS
jgi:hypothetical protein